MLPDIEKEGTVSTTLQQGQEVIVQIVDVYKRQVRGCKILKLAQSPNRYPKFFKTSISVCLSNQSVKMCIRDSSISACVRGKRVGGRVGHRR